MKDIIKHLYKFSILLLSLWLFRPILFKVIGLEFINTELEYDYKFLWVYVLPICGLLIYFVHVGWPDKLQSQIRIAGGALLLCVFCLFISFISAFFGGFCGWLKDETLYIHKTKEMHIGEYHYDCGAYDSEQWPDKKLFKVRRLNHVFRIRAKCDLDQINFEHWKKPEE